MLDGHLSLKRKIVLSLLFVLFVNLVPSGYAAGDIKVGNNTTDNLPHVSIPIPVWFLDSNFKVITPNNVSCIPALGMNDRLMAFYVNSTTSLRVKVSLYLSCPNVSGREVRVPLNLSPNEFKMKTTILPPNITYLSENYTKVTVPVRILTTLPYPFPLELRSKNLSVYYINYNSTHLLVRVVISNLTVSPEMNWTLGYSDPSHYGLPNEIRLDYLVDKYNGDSYLLEGKGRRYIGNLPLYLPEFNVEYYLKGIQRRTDEFVKTIESNPWIIEDIINKVKFMNSTLKRNEFLSETVINFTKKIFEDNHVYLGIPFNLTTGESLYTLSPYVEFHRILPLPEVNDDFGFSEKDKNLTKSAVEDYLRLNKTEKLMKLLDNAIKVRRFVTPSLSTNTFVSVSLPLQPGDMLVLPLPKEYQQKLNASYLYFYIPHSSKEYLHVEYDPRIFDPNRTVREWRTAIPFINLLRGEVTTDFANFLSSSLAQGKLNYTALRILQLRVSSEVESFVQRLSPVTNSTTAEEVELTENTSSQGGFSEREIPTEKAQTSRGSTDPVCGPAFFVPLVLIPAWLWRKGA